MPIEADKVRAIEGVIIHSDFWRICVVVISAEGQNWLWTAENDLGKEASETTLSSL